jgi:hypothetical protein
MFQNTTGNRQYILGSHKNSEGNQEKRVCFTYRVTQHLFSSVATDHFKVLYAFGSGEQ